MAPSQGTPTPKFVEHAAQQVTGISTRSITLIGLMTGPKGARALLRDGGGKFRTIEPGDTVAGRTAAAIDAHSLILAKGGDALRLTVSESVRDSMPDVGNGLKSGR